MRLKGFIAGTVLACVAFTLVGCSSDSKSTTSTTANNAAACADKAALQKSIKKLSNPNTLTGGKSSVTNALDDVKSDLDALKSSAKSDLKPRVDAVQSAVDELKTAVGKLGSGSITESFESIGKAITKVASTSQLLVDQVQEGCTSS